MNQRLHDNVTTPCSCPQYWLKHDLVTQMRQAILRELAYLQVVADNVRDIPEQQLADNIAEHIETLRGILDGY